MASSNFVTGLLQIAQEEGNTVTLEAIRTQALAKIQAGGGSVNEIQTASVNGKSHTLVINKSADILFAEVSEAIRIFNNGVITATYFDFSYL